MSENGLDQTAEHLLRKFADARTHATIEDHDWQLLYQLTIHLHCRGLKTHHKAIRDYLVNHGWPLRKATWLCTEYRHFLELLAFCDENGQKTPR